MDIVVLENAQFYVDIISEGIPAVYGACNRLICEQHDFIRRTDVSVSKIVAERWLLTKQRKKLLSRKDADSSFLSKSIRWYILSLFGTPNYPIPSPYLLSQDKKNRFRNFLHLTVKTNNNVIIISFICSDIL